MRRLLLIGLYPVRLFAFYSRARVYQTRPASVKLTDHNRRAA